MKVSAGGLALALACIAIAGLESRPAAAAVGMPQGCVLVDPEIPTPAPNAGVNTCTFTLSGVDGEFVVAAEHWSVEVMVDDEIVAVYGDATEGNVFATEPRSIADGSTITASVSHGVMAVGNGEGF